MGIDAHGRATLELNARFELHGGACNAAQTGTSLRWPGEDCHGLRRTRNAELRAHAAHASRADSTHWIDRADDSHAEAQGSCKAVLRPAVDDRYHRRLVRRPGYLCGDIRLGPVWIDEEGPHLLRRPDLD